MKLIEYMDEFCEGIFQKYYHKSPHEVQDLLDSIKSCRTDWEEGKISATKYKILISVAGQLYDVYHPVTWSDCFNSYLEINNAWELIVNWEDLISYVIKTFILINDLLEVLPVETVKEFVPEMKQHAFKNFCV